MKLKDVANKSFLSDWKKLWEIKAVTCDIILGNRGSADICIHSVTRYFWAPLWVSSEIALEYKYHWARVSAVAAYYLVIKMDIKADHQQPEHHLTRHVSLSFWHCLCSLGLLHSGRPVGEGETYSGWVRVVGDGEYWQNIIKFTGKLSQLLKIKNKSLNQQRSSRGTRNLF